MKSHRVIILLLITIIFLTTFPANSQNYAVSLQTETEFRSHPFTEIWRGEKKDTMFQSCVLGYAKNVTIFTPNGFSEYAGEKYPVIVTFDRNGVDLTNFLLHSVDILEMAGQTPRSIVVSIESGGEPGDRTKEARWSIDGKEANGERYDRFVFDEPMPHIIDKYRGGKNQVIVYGHSWFGYHTAMILKNHMPDLLGVISASPCCLKDERIDEIVQAVKECSPLKYKFFLRIASGRDIGDDLEVYRKLKGRIGMLRLPENFDYKSTWYSAAMHMEVPVLQFIQLMYEIYADWACLAFTYSDPYNNPTFDDDQLYDSLQKMPDEIYWIHIPISDRHLDWRVEYHRYIKDERVTLECRLATWKFMVSRFGETPELYFNIASYYDNLGQSDSSEYYIRKCRSFDLDDDLKGRIKELEKEVG